MIAQDTFGGKLIASTAAKSMLMCAVRSAVAQASKTASPAAHIGQPHNHQETPAMTMRPLTNDERAKMRHALGLGTSSVAYRNRYITTGRDELWEGLCAAGAAARNSYADDAKQWCYWVTEAGYDAVREPGEHRQHDTVFTHSN